MPPLAAVSSAVVHGQMREVTREDEPLPPSRLQPVDQILELVPIVIRRVRSPETSTLTRESWRLRSGPIARRSSAPRSTQRHIDSERKRRTGLRQGAERDVECGDADRRRHRTERLPVSTIAPTSRKASGDDRRGALESFVRRPAERRRFAASLRRSRRDGVRVVEDSHSGCRLRLVAVRRQSTAIHRPSTGPSRPAPAVTARWPPRHSWRIGIVGEGGDTDQHLHELANARVADVIAEPRGQRRAHDGGGVDGPESGLQSRELEFAAGGEQPGREQRHQADRQRFAPTAVDREPSDSRRHSAARRRRRARQACDSGDPCDRARGDRG